MSSESRGGPLHSPFGVLPVASRAEHSCVCGYYGNAARTSFKKLVCTVIADASARHHVNIFIKNGTANACSGADNHAGHDDRIGDIGGRVDLRAVGDDGAGTGEPMKSRQGFPAFPAGPIVCIPRSAIFSGNGGARL